MMGEGFKASDAYIELGSNDERMPSSVNSLPKGRTRSMKDLDRVHQFILTSSADDHEASPIDLRAVRRKIDWRIVPIMFLCYTMQFIDKVLLNVSRSARKEAQIGSTDLNAYLSMVLLWVCPVTSNFRETISRTQPPPFSLPTLLPKFPMVRALSMQLVETELGQSDLSYHWKPISYRKYRLRNG